MLCVSTSQGVYITDGQGASKCLGLKGMVVSQIAVQSGGSAVLAAVPELAEVCLLLRCTADIAGIVQGCCVLFWTLLRQI